MQKNENLQEMIKHIEEVMKIMDCYVPSRPGNKAFDHLEDAILWLQVMCQSIELKPVTEDKPLEGEVIPASSL